MKHTKKFDTMRKMYELMRESIERDLEGFLQEMENIIENADEELAEEEGREVLQLVLEDGVINFGDYVWWFSAEGPRFIRSDDHWENIEICPEFYRTQAPNEEVLKIVERYNYIMENLDTFAEIAKDYEDRRGMEGMIDFMIANKDKL